jgi:putative transcriptional regulator
MKQVGDMKTVFDQLMSGLDDVEAFLQGKREGFQVHAPEEVDVKHIRRCLKMTQEKFSDVFGFSLDSVKNWETGRRKPEAAARTLLVVIHKNPVAVLSAICPTGKRSTEYVIPNKILRKAHKGRSAHSRAHAWR